MTGEKDLPGVAKIPQIGSPLIGGTKALGLPLPSALLAIVDETIE
jgi:hypothetical protein